MTEPRLSPSDFLASWLPENGGLCRVCNASTPTADPLSCPAGCDLRRPYQTWRNYEIAREKLAPTSIVAKAEARAEERLQLPRILSLGELCAEIALREPTVMIVPGVVEAGTVTLLSAPPKTGKSHLITQLAADFSAGRPALDGTPMGPGVVLWIATDEPGNRLGSRLAEFDADMYGVRVFTRDQTPRVTITPEVFEALLEIEDPRLVVIDTLSQLAADNAIDPNEAKAVAPFMKRLVDAVQARPGCGAIFLNHSPHHSPRSSGSVQWQAIADATLVLRRFRASPPRPGESPDDEDETGTGDDGRRILEGVTRWNGPQRDVLSFRDGRYSLGAIEAPLIDRLRWLLRDTEAGPERTSQAAMASRLKVRDVTLAESVRQLIDRGEVRAVGNGRKRYIEPTSSMSLYTGREAGHVGSAAEAQREEKEPCSSRAEAPTHVIGKRKAVEASRSLSAGGEDGGFEDAARAKPTPQRTDRSAEQLGCLGEVYGEEKERKREPFSSRAQAPTRVIGKSKDFESQSFASDDDNYVTALLSDPICEHGDEEVRYDDAA